MIFRLFRLTVILLILLLILFCVWQKVQYKLSEEEREAKEKEYMLKIISMQVEIYKLNSQKEKLSGQINDSSLKMERTKKFMREKGYRKLTNFVNAIEKEAELQKSDELYIVVSLNDNKVSVKTKDTLVKEYTASFGSGKVLKTEKSKWIFETPIGVFPVKDKKENPVWRKPDWAFIENNEKIPPLNSPLRKVPGYLGKYGIYLGDGYLIHGVPPGEEDKIGTNVTHGCIRVKENDLKELYDTVQIGTNVLIR